MWIPTRGNIFFKRKEQAAYVSKACTMIVQAFFKKVFVVFEKCGNIKKNKTNKIEFEDASGDKKAENPFKSAISFFTVAFFIEICYNCREF